ncbi:MAG: hypothetical protein Roseis2KO_59000 [Roseivirga sp.]
MGLEKMQKEGRVSKTSTLRGLKKEYEIATSQLLEVLKFMLQTPKRIEDYRIEKEAHLEILELLEPDSQIKDHLSNEIKSLKGQSKIVYSMSLVYGIAHIESYLNNLTRLLLRYYWKNLKTKGRTLTYEEVLNFKSLDSLKENLIEKEVMLFSHMGIDEKISFFEKKLHVEFSYERVQGIRHNWNCIELQGLKNIFLKRNLILHNGSHVNHEYVKSTGYSDYEPGDKIAIDREYALQSLSLLMRISGSFLSVFKNKIENKKSTKSS